MKKNLLFLCFTIFGFYFFAQSQPSFVLGDFGNTWSDYQMIDRGVVAAVTIAATHTTDTSKFLFARDLSYNPKWCGSNSNYARSLNQKLTEASYYFTTGTWDHDLTISTIMGNFYTLISSKNVTANNDISILETTYAPVDIVAVSQFPAITVSANDSVRITATLSSQKNTNEKVFIRWSNDNWITSNFVEILSFDSAFKGIGTLPPQPAGSLVSYYLLSTALANPDGATIDYYSLKINNNALANYQYNVVATTGCPFYIHIGTDTIICGESSVVLNPGVSISPYGDSLLITYDATQGQTQLVGASKVYMHAGAELHTGGLWQYTTGTWGMDNGVGLMKSLGNNRWQIKINPVNYFGYPSDSVLNGIFMVFRDANGDSTGKGPLGVDIWLNMKISPPTSSFSAVTATFIKNPLDSIVWNDGSNAPTLIISTSGTYSVHVWNSNGCDALDTIQITMNSLPIVELGNDKTLCQNDSIILDAGSGFASYLWSTGSTAQKITVKTAGLFSITVTNNSGCTAFDVVNVTELKKPLAYFYYTVNNLTVNFTDTSKYGTTYSWDFTGDGITDLTTIGNVSHTYAAAGQYTVILKIINACGTSTMQKTIVLTGIETLIPLDNFNVFPNPAEDKITISFETTSPLNTTLSLENALGQIVFQEEEKNIFGKFNKNYNISNLSKGLYLLHIKTTQGERFEKILKN